MNNLKTIIGLLTAVTGLLPLWSVAGPGNPYKGDICILNSELQPEGDSLRIRFRCDAQGVKVASRQSIELVPILIGADTSFQMPAIAIKGRANYLISRREQTLASRRERAALVDKAPYAIIKGFGNKNPRQVEYSRLIAFEPWMNNAGLVVKKDLCGCGVTHPLGVSPALASVSIPEPSTRQIVIPHPFIAHLTYVVPQLASIRREIASEAALDFVVSKTDIRPDYMNNAVELARITKMVDSVRNDPHIAVRSISVIGFASPEGRLADNKLLSENRALALVNYLVPKFDFPREMYHVVFGGENWPGLRENVVSDDFSSKEQVLQIIDNVSVQSKTGEIPRKRALLNLNGGDVYRYLLRTYYPHLRKAICKIEYDITPLDAHNIEELLETSLEKLNVYDLYQAAHYFGEGTPRALELLQTAARIYPDDTTANLNAAVAALQQGNADAAEVFLSKARKECPEYDNAYGMLMILREKGDLAAEYFRKAADAGLEAAAVNLRQLTD